MAAFVKQGVMSILGIMLFSGCTAARLQDETLGRVEIGVGSKRLGNVAKSAISDMRVFFSKQLVFDSASDCAVRIMLDKQAFENESAERIDFDVLVGEFVAHVRDPKNAEALSLAGRRVAFVDTNRNFIAGQDCKAAKRAGADYVLGGRIISDDKITKADIRQRQTLISFWLLDLETGAKAWVSPSYLFKSVGQNDVIYR